MGTGDLFATKIQSNMVPIFLFELRYRLKRPATYIYALVLFVLGIIYLTTDAVRIGGGYGKVWNNAPYNLHQIISITGVLGLFFIMAFHAVPVYRDFEHKMDAFFYAYPIRKKDYLLGRFLGTFLISALAFFMLPLGMMLGELIARSKEGEGSSNFGPFSAVSYLWPYLISTLPTILLLGSMFFALVSVSRKIMYAYIVSISFIVFYSISLNLLSQLDNKLFAALLDPFGLVASDRVTEYWSIAEKNTQLVPVAGYFLWNRLLWLSIGLLVLGYAFFAFRMSPVADSGKKLAIRDEQKSEAYTKKETFRLSSPLQFSFWSTLVSLLKLELRQNFRNIFFISFLFAIALYLGMDAWYADQSFETGIYPVTGIMLESVTSSLFNILSMVLIIFLAGEMVWRERQSKMEGIYNAFPTSNFLVFSSKLFALLLVPVFLILIVPLVCIPIQLIKGYTHLELGLYAQTLLLFELPRLWLIAILAFCMQITLNNKFAAYGAILGYYLSLIGLSYLHIEHPLFRYASGLGYRYSDMNGFGDFIRKIQVYLLHWTIVALFLLSLSYLFLVRGVEDTFKARFREAQNRFKGSSLSKVLVIGSFLAMLASGAYITYVSLEIDHYTNSQDVEQRQVAYEKRFDYLKRSLHPSLTRTAITADMFPENSDLTIGAEMVFANLHKNAIDTLWFNVDPDGKLLQFDLSLPARKVFEDQKIGQLAYKLEKPLQSGDSLKLHFKQFFAFTGFENESPVKGNGTFFNNSTWPSVGFNSGFQIQDEDKRKKNGLPEIPAMASQLDSTFLGQSLFSENTHAIGFEATLSTSPDQIAVAPGYLQKEWTQNGRRYFHYRMDRPINDFFSILSARYATYKEKWNDVDITIYHHPWHTFNVKKMAEAVRHSLEYYGKNFSPYQHKQVRILEFPRYQSFAQSFDNTIPYSEGIGFIANLEEKDAIDYVYFVTAHEMAHQWWGHQITPANVRGGQFLSETMAEYSALMVMKKQYGIELMGRFLRRELNDYLSGRSRETKKENPLMDIEMQSYAYYNKGSLAMFNVMDLIGEERMNAFLGKFVAQYAFKSRTYPSTFDYYQMLITFLSPEQKELADDQLKRITLYKNRMLEAKGKTLKDGTFEVSMKMKLQKVYVDSLGGNETEAPFKQAVYVGLLNEQKVKKPEDVVRLEKVSIGPDGVLSWTTKKKPKYAVVDPLFTLTDILTEDNALLINWD